MNFKNIIELNKKIDKVSAKKGEVATAQYNELLSSLPFVGFADIKNMKASRSEVLSALKNKLGEMYEAGMKAEASKPLMAVAVPKYTARVFRGLVCVFKDSYEKEGQANRVVAEKILTDSGLHGEVESLGIKVHIGKMEACKILSQNKTSAVTKKLSFGGGKLWMKASQTRVVVSRG